MLESDRPTPEIHASGTPTVAVVVPATDRPLSLDLCLDALRASESPPDEIVVVDEPAVAGPAAARNAGARRAASDVVAFVDADVAIHPDAIERVRASFAADPELVAVFGSYDDSPSHPGLVSRFRNLLHHHVHTSSPGPAETFWAGLGAVRRDAFLAAGGFDAERYGAPAIEDIELGMRLTAAGGRIDLDPRIRATHLKRWTLRSMSHTDLLRRGAPWVRLAIEARRAPTALNLGWRHRLSALAALAVAAGAVLRDRRLAGLSLAALAALNARFIALLHRRGGVALALAGVPLLVIHHLVAVASVPVGVVQHLLGRDR